MEAPESNALNYRMENLDSAPCSAKAGGFLLHRSRRRAIAPEHRHCGGMRAAQYLRCTLDIKSTMHVGSGLQKSLQLGVFPVLRPIFGLVTHPAIPANHQHVGHRDVLKDYSISSIAKPYHPLTRNAPSFRTETTSKAKTMALNLGFTLTLPGAPQPWNSRPASG